MNKAILMGRLTANPEIRYTPAAEGETAVASFTLAVNRRYAKDKEKQSADFISCVVFGKLGEWSAKYLSKGLQIALVGRLNVRSWEDKEGKRHWITNVIAEEINFAESKKGQTKETDTEGTKGFYPIDESVEDDDLPF